MDKPDWGRLLVGLVTGGTVVLAVKLLPIGDTVGNAYLGAAWGAFGGLVLGLLSKWKKLSPIVPLGLATAAYALFQNFGAMQTSAFILGAAVVALAFGISEVGYFVLAGGAIAAATLFASAPNDVSVAPLFVGAALTAAAFIGHFARKMPLIAGVVVTLVIGIGLYLAGPLVGKAGGVGLWFTTLTAPLGGFAVYWLYSTKEMPARLSVFVATLIWLGVATLAFSVGKSIGLALALVAGVGVPMALGLERAVGTAAPLAALVWYRFVSQSDVIVSRSSDLSSFYLVIGLAGGLAFCGMAVGWRARVGGLKGTAGGAVWGLATGGVTLLTQAVFGAKGLSGLLVGTGFGSMVDQPERRPLSAAMVASTAAGAAALLVDLSDKISPESHGEKIKLFVIAAGSVLVVSGLMFLLQRDSGTIAKSEAVA